MTRVTFLAILFSSLYLLVHSNDDSSAGPGNEWTSPTTAFSVKQSLQDNSNTEKNAKDAVLEHNEDGKTSAGPGNEETSPTTAFSVEQSSQDNSNTEKNAKDNEDGKKYDNLQAGAPTTTISADVKKEIEKIEHILQYVPAAYKLGMVIDILAKERVELKEYYETKLDKKQEYYETKLDKKQEYYETKLEKKQEEFGIIKTLKAGVEVFARKLAIPTRLRHQAEIFPKNFLTSLDDAMKQIGVINQKLIASHLNPITRYDYVRNCTLQFASLAAKPTEKFDLEFPKAWNRLKRLDPVLECDVTNPTPLQTSLLNIYNSKSEDEGKQVWNSTAETVWKPRKSLTLSAEDSEGITALSSLSPLTIREALQTPGFKSIFKSVLEEEYAYDAIRLGNIFIKKDLAKKYKHCLWVFYDSKDAQVLKLQKKLEKKWPTKERGERLHTYCTKFDELLNLVSELDKHGPGLVPPDNLEPTPEEFEAYVKILNRIGGDDLGFVAETLYPLKEEQSTTCN